MFVMISAILLAWVPTAAYAGEEPSFPVDITTEDRKGIQGLDGPCGTSQNSFNISIRGKGEFTLDAGTPVPIPTGTGIIRVLFDNNNSDIDQIKFVKHNGFVALTLNPSFVSSILIDANIANKILCSLDIPKGTASLALTGITTA